MNVITEREKSTITDKYTGQNMYRRMGELMKHVKNAVRVKESVFFPVFKYF